MQKLENKTLQNFLERFIKSLKREKEYVHNDLISNQLDIPFIISSLYQSFKNNPSDYTEFISDLENYPDYGFSVENSRNDYNGIVDAYVYLSKYMSEEDLGDIQSPNYDYLLSFTYDERDYGYCMCTSDMEDYREDKHCCGHGCDATFCEFLLQKISYIKRDSWRGDEHDYWDFEDEFYLNNEELAAKKERKDREVEIRELRKRIEEDNKRLKELEGEHIADIPDCVKNCSTCKNHHANIPHTCDICTSLDQDEEYGMWEAKE